MKKIFYSLAYPALAAIFVFFAIQGMAVFSLWFFLNDVGIDKAMSAAGITTGTEAVLFIEILFYKNMWISITSSLFSGLLIWWKDIGVINAFHEWRERRQQAAKENSNC